MRSLALLFVLAAGVAVAEEKKEKPPSPDGTWIVTSIEIGGMKLSDEDLKKTPAKVELKGDKWKVTIGKEVSSGTSKVDATKKPVEIDIVETEGANKGRTMKGIVELKGDTMKVCWDGGGKGRPKEFSTKDQPGFMLLEYKREKK